MPCLNQCIELSLASHSSFELKPAKLGLFGTTGDGKLFQKPLIQGPMIFKLKRTQRVRDPFKRVTLPVRIIVSRVDTPLITSPRVRDVSNPIQNAGSRKFTLGADIEIFARKTAAPSGSSPSRIVQKSASFSAERTIPIRAVNHLARLGSHG